MGSCLSADGAGCGLASGPRKGGRRRKAAAAAEEDAEVEAHAVLGRMAGNGASNVASLFTRQGKKGPNQDAMVVWENFNRRSDTVFCGVFDGHGPHGHFVARKVRDTLPLKLCDSLIADDYVGSPTSYSESSILEETLSPCSDEEAKSPSVTEQKEEHPEVLNALKESFLKAFKVVDKELKLHRNIDCVCSGTTAVTLVKQGQDLIIGNLGDSRAVLGTRDRNGLLVAHQLTVDLKPDLPREAQRIKRCSGRVFAHQDEPDVARIWLPNYNSPGLAMARAFGDFCLKDFGLISVPDVSYRRITEKDEFIVLATDGVWDVLSNQEVVDAIASSSARSFAARGIVTLATRAWRFKYPTSKMDDCAVVCLFLDNDAAADGSLELSVNSKESTSSPKTPGRSSTTHQSSKKVLPEDVNRSQVHESDVASDTNVHGDERSSLEGFSRLNTLVTLPMFVAAEKHVIGTKK